MDILTVTLNLLKGFAVTCELFGLTLLFSLPLGLLISFGSKSGIKFIRVIIRSFIWVIRGTPLMLQVITVYYGPALLFQWGLLPRFAAVLIAFVINYACYFAEIFRGGISAVPEGQYEAGAVLGLTKRQIFCKIVLLQVIKNVLAPISNEIITLVKDTSLARVIMVEEILFRAQKYTAYGYILPLFYSGVFYLLFVGALTLLFNYAEKKLAYIKV